VKIIGIDPGIATTGYGVLQIAGEKISILDCGIISTAASIPIASRLKTIREDMLELLNLMKPEVAAVECLYFGKNVKTNTMVAQARGIILEVLAVCEVKQIFELTPTEVKHILFGQGRASKREIQNIVASYFNLADILKPDDANDAIAIGLACIRRELFTRF